MALEIGDNFQYLGKKFLDARQSFPTLEAMNNCKDVPERFITVCEEDGKRYEFVNNEWIEYVTTGGGGTSDIDIDDIFYVGNDPPTKEDVLWLNPTSTSYPELTIDNPIIQELLASIVYMKNKISQLEKDVEYLKLYGGGGGTPDTPTGQYLLLEDGTCLLLEDGTPILLEESSVDTTMKLLLEDGTCLLLEDGTPILLE